MAHDEFTISLKQRLRIRELAKYYGVITPLPISDGSATNTGGDFLTGRDFVPQPPRIAKDQHLTALAQLAACRLKRQRCFVSIIDHAQQHIIAEATQTISTSNQNIHDDGDALIFGAQSFPLSFGICPRAMDIFQNDHQLVLDSSENRVGKDFIVIEDLLAEKETKHSPCIRYFPDAFRYYVEVPLRADSGHLIGSICVVDPKPGPFSQRHVADLGEVAKLVVSHLDFLRMKEDHHRAERLLEGLSHFLHGKDSLSDWSKATAGQENIPNVYPQTADLSIRRVLSLSQPTLYLPDLATASSPSTAVAGDATDLPQGLNPSTDTNTSVASQTAIETPTTGPDSTKLDVETGFDPLLEDAHEAHNRPILASVATRHVFSKASNLIREAMDLDATCFLEVPQNERFKTLRRRKKRAESEQLTESTSAMLTPSDSSTDVSVSEIKPKDDSEVDANEHDLLSDTLCHRLGFSTRIKSSLARSIATDTYLTVPASLLSALTEKYPSGHIFHFDTRGSISSGDDSSSKQQKAPNTSLKKRKNLSVYLSHHFPTSRSLIFYPLYDNDKQQIFAGFLGWTSNPARALQNNELTYVAGFANSIMCEVMRIEALAIDKTKSDFMSSISHELRSPLHGILAAYQLASELEIQPDLADYLSMIDTCARSLLDIMDHLLDFAKINHFTQQQTEPKLKKGRPRPRSHSSSLTTEIDLLAIVEETTAVMAGGYTQLLSPMPQTPQAVDYFSGPMIATPKTPPLPVPIVLNIANNDNWMFISEAGSWRRIIMNLVGNSLKYTRHGHITVSVNVEAKSSRGISRMISVKISDTGQGISEEYLKHRLYTPFAQEDNLSVGTGLGLSLVHQIVTALRGEINIQSEAGTGTDILVQIPLHSSDSAGSAGLSGDGKDERLTSLHKNKTFEIYGFEDPPSIYQESTGILSPRTKALIAMRSSISAYLRDWFGLHQEHSAPSLLVIEGSYLNNHLETLDKRGNNLLIVGIDGWGTTMRKIQHANYTYMQPPIGPRGLARTLENLFKLEQKTEQTKDLNMPNATVTRTIEEVLAAGPNTLRIDTNWPKMVGIEHRADDGITERANSRSLHTTYTAALEDTTEKLSSAKIQHASKDLILLVDDNAINLRILESCVQKLNLQHTNYLTATNGKEALDQYVSAIESGTRVSIVLMDISMPVMDGITSTRHIRAFEKRQKRVSNSSVSFVPTQIIALTGLASEVAQNEVEDSGFDQYLRKPVKLNVVRDLISKYCS